MTESLNSSQEGVGSDASELAMFPLGSTVFPGQVMPLHIFEERYRTMLKKLTEPEAHGTFGIVLIDRGHEVGGGDTRVKVATRVNILEAEELDDGRWGVVTAGVERLNIVEWLPDDPFPRAMVTARAVKDDGGSSLDDLESLLRETMDAAARRAGVQPPGEIQYSSDPQQRLDQMSALSPLIDFDRQHVLEASTTSVQMERLTEALEGKLTVLRAVIE